MIKAHYGDRLDALLHGALPFLFRRRVNPNVLTVVGALVSLAAALAFPHGWFVTAGLLVLAGGAFDLIDGVVARHHGIATRFGAFLDSTLDRVVDLALLLGIAAWYALEGQAWNVILAGYTMAASVLVSYLQARAELEMPSFKGGFFERGERIAILALGALSGWMVPALWVVAVGSTVTVVQRFARAARELQAIDLRAGAGVVGGQG